MSTPSMNKPDKSLIVLRTTPTKDCGNPLDSNFVFILSKWFWKRNQKRQPKSSAATLYGQEKGGFIYDQVWENYLIIIA